MIDNRYHNTAQVTMLLSDVVKFLNDEFNKSIFPDDYDYQPFRIISGGVWKDLEKNELEERILRKYWNREIGLETIDSFVLQFQNLFIENLYNVNRKNFLLTQEWDIFRNYYEKTSEEKTTDNETRATSLTASNSESETTGTGTNEATPYTNYPTNANYTSSRDKAKNNATSSNDIDTTGTTNYEGVDKVEKIVEGYKDKTQAEIIATFLKIFDSNEKMFIDSLNEVFLNVY